MAMARSLLRSSPMYEIYIFIKLWIMNMTRYWISNRLSATSTCIRKWWSTYKFISLRVAACHTDIFRRILALALLIVMLVRLPLCCYIQTRWLAVLYSHCDCCSDCRFHFRTVDRTVFSAQYLSSMQRFSMYCLGISECNPYVRLIVFSIIFMWIFLM